MLAEFKQRLGNDRETELQNCLIQIEHIIRGRLEKCIAAQMGSLTTHVLDTASGQPAMGMQLAFYKLEGGGWHKIKLAITDANGRTDAELLTKNEMALGKYRIEFDVAAYFRAQGSQLSEPPFLDIVPVEFTIYDLARHYHIPLLCSPWSYTTYQGN